MALDPDEEREKLKEQRNGDRLYEKARLPSLAALAAIVVLFTFVSIIRADATNAFIFAFLLSVIVTILSLAYFFIVLIHKNA